MVASTPRRAVRDERLQELERLLLRLALRDQRLAVARDRELAERAQRERPRPVGDVRTRRRQLAPADQRAHVVGLDAAARARAPAPGVSTPARQAQEAVVTRLAAFGEKRRAAVERAFACRRRSSRRVRAQRGARGTSKLRLSDPVRQRDRLVVERRAPRQARAGARGTARARTRKCGICIAGSPLSRPMVTASAAAAAASRTRPCSISTPASW